MPNTESLTSIATNSELRIYERIRLIKGDDKKISSQEEAKAILAIPSNEVVWSDNKNELPYAIMEANHYLKHGDSNLLDMFEKAGKYIKKQGISMLARLSEYMRTNEGHVAQNTK